MMAIATIARRIRGAGCVYCSSAAAHLAARVIAGGMTAEASGWIADAGRILPSIPTNIGALVRAVSAQSPAPPTMAAGITAPWMQGGGCTCSNNGADLPAVKATVGDRMTRRSGWIMAAGLISQSKGAVMSRTAILTGSRSGGGAT